MRRKHFSAALAAISLLATASAAASAARADTIYLSCTAIDAYRGKQILTVDTTNNTVNYDAKTLPANISVASIDWQWHSPTNPQGVYDINAYHIDRTTGVFTDQVTFYYPNGNAVPADGGPATASCTKTDKPKTQF